MQYFAANQRVSFSEDFESQILGKFITKNTTFLPCSKAFHSGQKREVDLWRNPDVPVEWRLLSGSKALAVWVVGGLQEFSQPLSSVVMVWIFPKYCLATLGGEDPSYFVLWCPCFLGGGLSSARQLCHQRDMWQLSITSPPARSLLALWQEVKIGLCLHFILFRNELPLRMLALNKMWFAQAC